MFILLTGTDGFRIHLREQELRDTFLVEHAGAESFIFDGRDEWGATQDSLLRGALSGGLFSMPRIIVLRHIEVWDETVGKKIQSIVENSSDEKGRMLVATMEKSGRAKKVTEFEEWFAKVGKQEMINIPIGAAREKVAKEFIAKLGTSFTFEPGALSLVLERTGRSTGLLFLELHKLALYSRGTSVSLENVRALLEEPDGESVAFPALDALVRGNRARALALFRHEENTPDAVFKLFGLFAWQVRQAIMVKDEYERGTKTAEAIATAIGAKPFSVKKLLPLLPKLSLARLEAALSRLSLLDWEMKTGQTKPGVALDLFVWKF